MKVWIGAEMEHDVAETFRLARNEVETGLNQYLLEKSYDLELESFDCIAVVRDDIDFKEITRYSQKKREMDFRLIIDHQDFKISSFEERKQLILDMLTRAADILATKKSVKSGAALQLRDDLVAYSASK